MRANEITTESTFSKDIKQILVKKGYKLLGHGVDQMAFLEPGTNMILKIFGTRKGFKGFTPAQYSFKAFADFCIANPNNEFLPQFMGWETFEFKGQTYLQIRTERLFEFKNTQINRALSSLSRAIYFSGRSKKNKEELIRRWLRQSDTILVPDEDSSKRSYMTAGVELMTYLGEEKFNLLWDTITELNEIASKKNWTLDLHEDNFMLGSDGHIVISDPFYNPH